MNRTRTAVASILMAMAVPLAGHAADQDLQQKVDNLSKEVEALKQQVDQTKKKSLGQWLTIGGDYRFRYDYLNGEIPAYLQFVPPGSVVPVEAHRARNEDLYSNRFGLDLKAKATKDVSVTARLLMYKNAGMQDDSAVRDSFFADRAGLFDGTIGHVPGDSRLAVDRVYATWNNIAGQPVWFSIGRRPSTGGIPTNLKQNNERPGNSGVPALLVDYAFDGVTLGYAPDIEALPGAYGKFCYGRGFQTGITDSNTGNGLRNTDMIGINLVPYDTDPLRVELQYNRGMNIFNAPVILTGPNAGSPFGTPSMNLGNIDWYGLDFIGKAKKVGPGEFNWFIDGAVSVTHPNDNQVMPGVGLMYSGTRELKKGWAVYAGGRYDLPTGTKLGLEYNHGSRDWITFAPAADDIWTSKVGARGNVYEGYVIQELKLEPISSYLSKVFFKVGYQYYDFDYTGSNNWVGGSTKIADVNSNPQLMVPVKTAQDVYATFEVHF